MIRLFQSNNMTRLVEAFADQGATPSQNPFQPATVVVQSYGMGQWLKLQLAERQGIAANIDCLLPANLVWRLYQQLLPLELPNASPFSTERLTWLVMQALPNCEGDDYAQVQQFLSGSGDAQIRAYQLAEKIAVLYDQYLIYRPDWITGWEVNSPEVPDSWQADLWRRLVDTPSLRGRQHRSHLHKQLLARLRSPDPIPAAVPQQLSVFGVSSLPLIHLGALRALSTHIDVDLYFLNPCQHYWGDIVSEKDVARRSIKRLIGKDMNLEDEDYLEVGNPLLSSMGKQGREYLELLLEIDELDAFEEFQPPSADSMLDIIKTDILELTFGGEFGSNVVPTAAAVRPGDNSVQVHVCHSKMREVEVLYDQLLHIMDTRPDITPRDIIVMSPNIAEYAPYIEAVFPKDRLFYGIADRSLDQESAVLLAFTSLLGLPDMRLTATEVLDLLEVPTIARKFGLLEDDLLTLTRWIRDAGIRWELDGNTKQHRWDVPPDDHNTWRFGLDRLLLGYAMDDSYGAFEHVLPKEIDAGDANLLGTLCEVVDLISEYRARLSESRTVPEWRSILLGLLEDFFEPVGDEELDLGVVRELVIRLEGETLATGFDEPLSPRMIRYWLDEQLSVAQQGRGFISGGITFATLVPMRSIPFKVVCLMGMNDGVYPREDRPPTFDLMSSNGYRKGDRSKRNDDRYLFLEALLSAQACFYVSYEGRSMKDNQARPPSVLIGELIDYMNQVFDTDPVIEHPLQPFSEEYYSDAYPRLVTYRQSWYQALAQPEPATPFVTSLLPIEPELVPDRLDKLARFFRHPARYFLRERLGIWFDEEDISVKETESFQLDNLERYSLAQGALEALLGNHDLEDWRQRATDSGLVMPGSIGTGQLDRELNRAALVFDKTIALIEGEPQRINLVLAIDGRSPIEGTVINLYGDRIVDIRAGVLRKRQLMEIWLRHLFANAALGEIETIMVSTSTDARQAKCHRLSTVPAETAIQLLDQLVMYYETGIQAPLPFLPETSFIYANHVAANSDPNAALEAAANEWRQDRAGGESQDRDYRRLFDFPTDFDESFQQTAIDIYTPLQACWEDLK